MSLFDEVYKKRPFLFGRECTAELAFVVDRFHITGKALELGCGDGRDTYHMLKSGLTVMAVDKSENAIKTLRQRGDLSQIEKERMTTISTDVNQLDLHSEMFDFVYSITLFDHLSIDDGNNLLSRIWKHLSPGGFFFSKVHTVDDVGYTHKSTEVSEFASEIKHYYKRNELLQSGLLHGTVLYYIENTELDLDHGDPHYHAFATILLRKDGN